MRRGLKRTRTFTICASTRPKKVSPMRRGLKRSYIRQSLLKTARPKKVSPMRRGLKRSYVYEVFSNGTS